MNQGRRLVMSALLMALVVGCRVGPNYRPPGIPQDAGGPIVSVNRSVETTAAVPDAWWRLYSDPRLDALVAEAINANHELAAAEANLAGARAVLSAAQSAHLPSTSVNVGGLYGRDAITDEILELGGHRPQTIWLFEDVFQAAYEVDLFGRVHRAVEAASANTEAVTAARDSVRVVVAAETARAYAAICTLGEQLSVAQHSLDVVAHEADIAVKRHEVGANSDFDVARSQALLAQVQASIAPIEGQRQFAMFELAAILGRTPAHAPVELAQCVTPPRLDSLIPVGDGAALLKRRPDVRQAERKLAAATAQIGVATADLYPTIRLVGFYGGAATEVPQLNTNVGRIWGVGPSISWAFPNMSGPRARVRQAKAVQAAALASFDSIVLNALKETEQMLALYNAALNTRQSLEEARVKIHLAYRIASDQFAAGSLSSLELLTTEQTLVAIDAAVASSDASLTLDQIAVFKALGGGWRRQSQPESLP